MSTRPRLLGAALGLLAAAGAGACSAGGGAPDHTATCALVERLANSARPVEESAVGDPDQFDAALEVAVTEYVAVVGELRERVPEHLRDDLDRLEAAVSQYRFGDAIDARVALDDYVDEICAPAGDADA